MKSWYEFYKDRMNARYQKHIRNKYAPFLTEILKTNANFFMEIGCGAGNITRVLREESKASHLLVDSCPKMLGLALENNPSDACVFICEDVRTIWNPKDPILAALEAPIVHSHGLLEHFEDRDIRYIVQGATNYSRGQIHFVPGHKYEYKSRGDERLMTPQQWLEILQPMKTPVRIESFNDGYDLMIKVGDL